MLFPYHVNHLALNWRVPLHRGAIESLPGTSRSSISISAARDCPNVASPALAGVVLRRHRFGARGASTPPRRLMCYGACGPDCLRFRSSAPARVSSVVFIESGESEANRRVLNLRHVNPNVEAQSRGALFGGLDDRHTAAALAAVAREALESDALKQWEDVLDGNDLLSIAARVTAPTLYLHAADDDLVPLAAGRALVRRLANSKLMVVPGNSGMDVWRDRGLFKASRASSPRALVSNLKSCGPNGRRARTAGPSGWPFGARGGSASATSGRQDQPADGQRVVHQPQYRFPSPPQHLREDRRRQSHGSGLVRTPSRTGLGGHSYAAESSSQNHRFR